MGKNTSSKDEVHWGRRPPFIGGEESNSYPHSLHRAVLPLDLTVLPQMVAVLLLASGTKKYIRAYHHKTWDEFLVRSGTTVVGAAVVPLWSSSKKLHPLQFTVVPLQPLPKQPQLLQTDSEFNKTKFVGKLTTWANTILIEISRNSS